METEHSQHPEYPAAIMTGRAANTGSNGSQRRTQVLTQRNGSKVGDYNPGRLDNYHQGRGMRKVHPHNPVFSIQLGHLTYLKFAIQGIKACEQTPSIP